MHQITESMNLQSIIGEAGRRSKYLILAPDTEWQHIVSEKTGRTTALFSFFLPWCFLITLAAGLGAYLFESRLVFSFGYMVFFMISVFFKWVISVFGSAWLMTEWLPQWKLRKQPGKVFVMYTYSLTPAFFTESMVALFPDLALIRMLGFYSLYVMLKGNEVLFPDSPAALHNRITTIAFGLFFLLFIVLQMVLHHVVRAMFLS